MKTTTDMQLVSTDRLIPYVNNARTHSPEQINKLRSSLREFGFINPVIIDKDFNVIAGHGRLMAAKEEGITEVPCVFVDYLTEAQKKAYIIADNRFAQDAGWDDELLRIEIESLQGADFDVSLTGFEADEIADLFAGDKESEVKDDDFDLTAALEKASFVETGISGRTTTMYISLMLKSIAIKRSPIPSAYARRPMMKNGQSAPNLAARSMSCCPVRPSPNISLSSESMAAQSLLPPPMPA